jgi:calcineurin-like phosphoesterase family protein
VIAGARTRAVRTVCALAVCVAAARPGRANGADAPRLVTASQPDSDDVTLFLIGDGGVPHRGFEPVLAALKREASVPTGGQRVIVFLGDNIYPRGLPDSTDGGRAEAERRIRAQVTAAESSGATTIFIPGNHDWDAERNDGWQAIRREAQFVRGISHDSVLFLPANGCPGPAVFDAGKKVRLLLLDTQWWLHPGPKPAGSNDGCTAATTGAVVDSLRSGIASAGGRAVVVLAHHPIYSGGAHAEHWNIRDYIGSGPVILFRRILDSPQDFRSPVNTAMRADLQSAFVPLPPFIYASGHDHGLQVLSGSPGGPHRYLVSGAGAYEHLDPLRRIDRTLFEDHASGYMRLDFPRASGPVRLGVHVVDGKGNMREAYSDSIK